MAQAMTRRYDHIKYRNMFLQVLAYIFTLSLYGIYWFYSTLKELYIANGAPEKSALLWTVLLFVPIANLFSLWRHAAEVSKFGGEKYPTVLLFILWIIFPPVVWILAQLDLNRAAQFSG